MEVDSLIKHDYFKFYDSVIEALSSFSQFKFIIAFILILAYIHITRRRANIYLDDFACFQPPEFHRVSIGAFIEHSALREKEFRTSEVNEFEKKVITRCVFQKADDEGKVGVSLSRTVVHVAGEALKTNLTTLGPLVLPYSEQIRFAFHFVRNKIRPWKKKQAPYVPNFKKAFDHFCIHAGGKAVIDAIKDRLSLSDRDVEASKMTLYRFGNTSSSSTWYSLCYLEAKKRVKKGDMVFQLCFGSGFKCNCAVWKCISKEVSKDISNAWTDRINRYPVDVPEINEH
ncbi:probable 3-ketoacyl-CoA synthase 21 [Chenopodium quinoa]|uniref:probable 3-ketoacyl-CoA synthase 21 n=1 Tax=Chenopodium quinoa TaxID=63459 RepID=UPI000B7926C7|nr:probable 3-ketoacyl-CoA synthase 21 [Chenopodium quinoa]